ncbi:unnamed protein product, partial [Dovyalis caffra]
VTPPKPTRITYFIGKKLLPEFFLPQFPIFPQDVYALTCNVAQVQHLRTIMSSFSMERSLSRLQCLISKSSKKQENEESQDMQKKAKKKYKALISTLPKERGSSVLDTLYQYQGFWIPINPSLKGMLFMQDHFKAQPTDIFLASPPKCGTTWLKALIFAIINRAQFDLSTHPLLTANPHDLVPFLEGYLYEHQSVSGLEALPSPRVIATHSPYPLLPNSMVNSGCRFVYVCRDPKDAVVSMWHFTEKLLPKLLPRYPIKDVFEKFCRGVSHYGPFWDHVLGYWKLSLEMPEKVLFLKYEDLKKDPLNHVKRLAKFLGQPFTQAEESDGAVQEIIKLCSFESLSNLKVNKSSRTRFRSKNSDFFRKGKVGDWENHLTEEMAAVLDHIMKEKLRDSGLTLKVTPYFA